MVSASGARRLLVGGLACLCGVTTIRSHAQSDPAAPGYTVAFKSFATNNTDIFIADRDGTRVRALAPHSALDYDASFSVDRQWIVFTSHRSGPARIYRVHPDGSELEALTDGTAFADQATLSPDGRTLAFVSSRSGEARSPLDLEASFSGLRFSRPG
jgi:Tol biopolymer transport system component